ncbi:OmpA family protein [Lewinella sp. LCG006]|uniref:OmpA family protein n=1 Tax=Lewinella sp. LCG006 TaxID=3231911 RepID=UPI00346138E7
MKNIFSLICCLVLGTSFLSAQPIGTSSYETMLELGETAMASNDYYRALEQYELAFEEREDEELVPLLAELNYQLRDYRQAERWYKRLLRRDPENKFIEQRYNFARVLKMQGKYDEAIQEFQQYLEASTNAERKRQAQLELAGAELGMSLPGNAQGVAVEALDRKKINTPVSQYTPTLNSSGRTLYYASWVGKDVIEADDDDDPEKFARIFQSQITVETNREGEEVVEYGDPEPLGVEINRPGYHSANVSLSPDGRRMFFNRILLTGNVPSESKIYLSEGGDGAWKSANEVVGVNGDYLALQPTVGELYGKEVLFFVSNMDGGEGGMDIYYATHQGEGVYGDPVNLGPGINTPGDEMTPYWFDGTLYFSSDGYPSLGGLDIFYAVWNGTEWSEPNNMGKAYNTEADELSFRLYDEGYKGFFTSNRPEGRSVRGKTCCDDIYGFTIARQFVDLVVGVFNEIDEAQKMPKREPLKGATVQLIDNALAVGTEGTQSLTMASGNRFDFGLNFERSYTVIASHPDFFPDTTTFTTTGVVDSKTFEERFFLKPREPEPIFDTLVNNIPIVMENILYDFDDDRITTSAEIDLTLIYELMTQYPDMKVELGSHTDSRGEDNYNKDLSQRRADSARRWLMRKGIDRTRIVPQGYGETVPQTVSAKVAKQFPFLKEGDILTEAFILALPNEEQQEAAFQLNRRTEFKILEGPTSIQVKSTRLRKQDENNRGNNIGAQVEQNDPVKISQMSTLYGQTNLKNVPIMQFTERTKKIGVVKKGEKRTFSYTFTNRGDTDLIIDLISACDCTTTNQDELVGKRFKPGMSGTINVIFDSSEKDEDETIDIDIYLRNNDNKGNPIVEMLNYSFGLKL